MAGKRTLKWIALGLVLALALTAGAKPDRATGDNDVMSLTLDQALSLAEKNNADIRKAAVARDQAALKLDQAKDQASDARRLQDKNGDSYSIALARDVAIKVAQRTLDEADMSYDIAVRAAKLGVTGAYYSLQQAEAGLKVAEEKAARARETLKVVEAQYKVGNVARLDVDRQKVAVSAADIAVVEAEQKVATARIAFNKSVGLPIDQAVKLTTPATMAEYAVDYDRALEKALKEDMTLRAADMAAYAAQLTRETAGKYLAPNTYSYQLADKDYQTAMINLESARYDVNKRVLSAYYNWQNSRRVYDTLVSQVKIAEESARLTRLRYQVGMATLYEVNAADTQVADLKQKLEAALYGYNLAVSQFKYGVFMDVSAASAAGSTGSAFSGGAAAGDTSAMSGMGM